MSKFEKVSFNEFFKAMDDTFWSKGFIDLTNSEDHESKKDYEDLKLPKRATAKSAGYDFYAPFSFELKAGQSIKIPTGIKCKIDDMNFLAILPRSSYGFKYGMKLVNQMGVIDCDYYNNENNEGHIFIKFTVDKNMEVKKGDAFAQGIFLPYGLTEDDNVTEVRTGGIGSTTK